MIKLKNKTKKNKSQGNVPLKHNINKMGSYFHVKNNDKVPGTITSPGKRVVVNNGKEDS